MAADPARSIERFNRLIAEGEQLDSTKVTGWVERARLAVIAAYGEESSHLRRFDGIRYNLSAVSDRTPRSAFDAAKLQGARTALSMLKAFVEDLDALRDSSAVKAELHSAASEPNQVFVVHGREDGIREQVARLLERLGLEPIVLQEQVDRGRTVIEKFEHHALKVGYAVILLTPDDFGRGPDESDWPDHPNRARQNVILELGYFMGSLGRERTAALYVEGTQLPSDIHGMLYLPFDGSWELRLAKEMRGAGLPIDLNRL